MRRLLRLSALLGVLTLAMTGCSKSPAPTSSTGQNGGAVVGVAIPSSVSVVTANNANAQ